MNNKFTQGLWAGGGERIRDSRGRLIATVHYSGFDSVNGIALEEGRANSALISASPDLLEACNQVLSEIVASNNGRGFSLSVGAIEDLKAAIAKAEGKK